MSIDYDSLFASNFFTRAQVDILIQLAQDIIAQGGGGGGVSDPLKADKTTLIIAGDYLIGGGDLSADRTLAVNIALLDARYPVITDGTISATVIPAASVTGNTWTAASDAAMIALSGAVKGDLCIRTDSSTTYVLSANPYSTLGNWTLLPAAGGAVSSFNARTGAVTPTTGDYTWAMLGSKPTTLSGFGITDAQPLITATTSADYYRGDKTMAPLNKAAVGLSNVDNTADNSKPLGTAQLATLSATSGSTLIGHVPPGTGGIGRPIATVLNESALSLRGYALADGSDDTARVQNWLNALVANNRRGYVPAGDYLVGDLSVTTDYLHIEMHPQARFLSAATGTNPMLLVTSSTGTATARVGVVRINGGQIDLSNRTYTTTLTGLGISLNNFATVDITGVAFKGGASMEAAIAAGKAGTALLTTCCDSISIERNTFTGFAEQGLLIRGGTSDVATNDDGVGALIHSNHFIKCQIGWLATRATRNISASGNNYDSCYIGCAAREADAVKAARVNINNEVMRRPSLMGIDLREQVGCVVTNNRIIDTGYKLDGATATTGTAIDIYLEGCIGTKVANNVLRMNDLAVLASSYGIRSTTYNSIAPADNTIVDNYLQGKHFGISSDGTDTTAVYRGNDFNTVTTNYDTIAAQWQPFGNYTPTPTGVTNVTSVTPSAAMWRRIEQDIEVNVHFQLDPVAASTITEFTLNLPVDPGVDFSNDSDLIGTAYSPTAIAGGYIIANTAAAARNARVLIAMGADASSHSWTGQFSYRLNAPTTPPPPPPPAGSNLTDSLGNLVTDETGQFILV